MRVTEKEMMDRFRRCVDINPRLQMGFCYGKQQVELKAEKGSGIECTLSGLLTKPQMMDWIDGFLAGHQDKLIPIFPYHGETPEGYSPGQLVLKFATIAKLEAMGWNIAIINGVLYVTPHQFAQR